MWSISSQPSTVFHNFRLFFVFVISSEKVYMNRHLVIEPTNRYTCVSISRNTPTDRMNGFYLCLRKIKCHVHTCFTLRIKQFPSNRFITIFFLLPSCFSSFISIIVIIQITCMCYFFRSSSRIANIGILAVCMCVRVNVCRHVWHTKRIQCALRSILVKLVHSLSSEWMCLLFTRLTH